MKAIWILCNESIAGDVMELLEKDGVSGYTCWNDVLGCHHGCRTHWNNAVFPGRNKAFFVAAEDQVIQSLADRLCCLKARQEIHQAGLKAFIQPLDSEI